MKFRVLQKLSVMLIVLSILTSLYSCGSEDVPANRDKGISSVDGDESTGCTLPSPTMIDYKTDKSVFNINEVKVTYYYGFPFGKNPDFEQMISQGRVYPYVDLIFTSYAREIKWGSVANPDPETKVEKVVKRVENIMSEDYMYITDLSFKPKTRYDRYRHSEELIVPAELFLHNEGFIRFDTYYRGTNELTGENLVLGNPKTFYYEKLDEDTVKLYRSYYDAHPEYLWQ